MSRHLFNNSAQYHEGAQKSQYTAKVTTETTEKETETVTPTAPRSANMYVGDVLDNQLDALNSPSYNIKLYMIGAGSKSTSTGTENTTSPDSDNSNSDDQRQNQSTATTQLSGGGYLNDAIRAEPGQTVVLAQTGVTEVGIDNVELVTVPGGVSGSEASTLNFTITQPNAADFPDQIIKARAFLGIPLDATDAPLFVEINFTGYSEAEGEGSQDGEGSGKPVNIGPYIYPVHLKNFNMSINTGGSTYDFETVVKDDLYTADVFFRLKKMFTTTGASIYDHLLDLQTQVNDHNGKNNAEERIDFGLDDATKTVPGLDIKDQTLDIGLGVETAAKSKNPVIAAATDVLEAITIVKDVGVLEQKENETEAELTARQATANESADPIGIQLDLKEGMKLDDIVGLLLSMNTEFMKETSRSENTTSGQESKVDNTKRVMWYRLKGSIKYGTWAEKKKLHQKTAHIFPYTYKTDITDIALYEWEVAATNSCKGPEMRQRLNQMKVQKAYEYIFTGRNDQITNVNIEYKNGVALLLPPDRGLLGDISLNAASILNSNPVAKTENIRDGVDKLIGAKNTGGNFFDQLSKLRSKGEEYLSKIGAAANFNDEQIKDLINIDNGNAAKKLEELLSNQATAQAIADAIGAEGSATSQANVTTQSDSIVPSGFVYGGDLTGGQQGRMALTQAGNEHNASVKAQEEQKAEEARKAAAADGVDEGNEPAKLFAQTFKELNKTGFSSIGATGGIKNNLFTYLYDQHAAQDFLMHLDMEIRGDPWWLGKQPQPAGLDKNPSGMATKNSVDEPSDSDHYITTDLDNFFMFSLNSPRFFDPNILDEDDNTGLWIKEGDGTSYFLSGIYRVKTATHKFNNGKYLIDVTSVKETAINLQSLDPLDGSNPRLNGQFIFEDSARKGFTSRDQDGYLSEEEWIEKNGPGKGASYVNGYMASDGRTAKQLLDAGKISSDSYNAWLQAQT